MSAELDVLKDVARRLDKAGLAYMVTGSFAANFYTVPRMTRDIDLVVEIRGSDVPRVLGAFQEGYYCDPDMVREAVNAGRMFNLIHQGSVVKVDAIVRKDTPYRREEFQRRKIIRVDDRDIFFVSPEDLVLSKLVWAKEGSSEMQLQDVSNLLATTSLDMAYVNRWAETLSVRDLLLRAAPERP